MQDMSGTVTSTANDFYDLAEASGVPVVRMPLPITRSLSIESGKSGIIGMHSGSWSSRGEEQAHLGHELGHCLYGGFYTRSAPYDVVERHEWKADKWYILHAIPKERLLAKLREGYDAWEIAEQLDTTEDYIRMAYYYYKDNA